MRGPELRLGVDVRAAGADVVLMDADDQLLGKAAVPARGRGSPVVPRAIACAVSSLGASPGGVTHATLGASHALTAVLEQRALRRVAVVRIGWPLTGALPPLSTWPGALRHGVLAGACTVAGAVEYDGDISAPLDEMAIARFLHSVAGKADAVAIAGIFSPIDPGHELAAAAVAQRELGSEVPISLSHEIGSLGLLARENATVLNAALTRAAREIGGELRAALAHAGMDAEPFLARNDGTAMALEHALRFPVFALSSRAAAGMRGAAYLSGVGDAVVVLVGTSSAFVGVLANGRPRDPDLLPEVEGIRMDLETPAVAEFPVGRGGQAFVAALQRAIARAWDGHTAPSLVVVGERSDLVPEELPGVSEVMRPAEGDVAPAVGMTVAPVSGEADVISASLGARRADALQAARSLAVGRAVAAGADPRRVDVVEVSEPPLSAPLNPAIRVRVRASGPRL
jgi:N-methylhydantoinase A/oxoprolinase/acetone carboxylase beta subunit